MTGSATALPAGTAMIVGSTAKARFSSAKTSAASTMTEPRRSAAAPPSTRSPSAPVTVVATALGEKRSRSSSSIRL
jgi:hypothetical protein